MEECSISLRETQHRLPKATLFMRSITPFAALRNFVLCPKADNGVLAMLEIIFATALQNDVVSLRTQTQTNKDLQKQVLICLERVYKFDAL